MFQVGLSLGGYQLGGGSSGAGGGAGGGGSGSGPTPGGGAASVSVNSPYGGGSEGGGAPLMQPSPQMQHSLSPRPGSSQGTDLGAYGFFPRYGPRGIPVSPKIRT